MLDTKPVTVSGAGRPTLLSGTSYRPLILNNASFTTAKMIYVRRAVGAARGTAHVRGRIEAYRAPPPLAVQN